MGVLEVKVEFKEDEHVDLICAWRSRWSSMRKRRKNRCFGGVGGRGGVQGG